MTTHFYFDIRKITKGNTAPIKISISHKGQVTYIPTGVSILPEQWDAKAQRITGHPQKAKLNQRIQRKKLDIDSHLYDLEMEGKLHGKDIQGIKRVLEERMNPASSLFLPYLDAFAKKITKDTTRYTYTHTADKIRAFDPNSETLTFEDITPSWLNEFNDWMGEIAPSQNARNIILRDIRTIFNDAITNEKTNYYPFRKFKIRATPTKSRALTLEQCRAIFNHKGDTPLQEEYIDMFKLTFYLGGISFCDLANLTQDNIIGGRVEYKRQKTGQFCSIGLIPEAQELIQKHKGTKFLVDINERGADYRTFMHNMGKTLKRVGMTYNPKTHKWEGVPIAPHTSLYWARYTVATIAAELGASQETIGAMLGHSKGKAVTAIYIRANTNKAVDKTLRGVIDTIKGDS